MIVLNNKGEENMILIVENEQLNRTQLYNDFKEQGFHVMFSSNVRGALRILVENRPLLIIVSLEMTNPDSFTFSRIIKNDEDTNSIMLLAMSNYEEDLEKALDAGFNGIVSTGDLNCSLAREASRYLQRMKIAI